MVGCLSKYFGHKILVKGASQDLSTYSIEAHDLAGDVTLKLLESHLNKLPDIETVGFYLKVCYRLALDVLRHCNGRRDRGSLERLQVGFEYDPDKDGETGEFVDQLVSDELEGLLASLASNYRLSDLFLTKHTHQAIERLLARLNFSDNEKLLLRFHLEHELPFSDIAPLLGETAYTTRRIWKRLMARINKVLSKETHFRELLMR